MAEVLVLGGGFWGWAKWVHEILGGPARLAPLFVKDALTLVRNITPVRA